MSSLVTSITSAPTEAKSQQSGTARDDFWVLAESAIYLGGRGVTFGPPLLQVAAINPGVYSIPVALHRLGGVAAQDKSLTVFADGELDHILVTPMVASLESPEQLLREATGKLKLGGHLVLLTPLEKFAPEHVAFSPESTREMCSRLHHWQCKVDKIENGKHLLILKKIEGRRRIEAPRELPAKRACVSRYGAIGDAIIMTPLIRQLKQDGYHVTLNVSGYCAPVFDNSPHIDNLIIQERDLIPNGMLGRYWEYWQSRYERYINLSESIEGDLLAVEGRPSFFTTKAWRHERMNRNYYDYTMERGGYPTILGTRGELFFTAAEERRASREFKQWSDKFVLVWAINGSSHHKVYPMMEALLREWFRQHPDVVCITTGDYAAKLMEFPHPQLIPRAAVWSLREAMLATRYAQCVIGPETMMTNAAGCFPTPKIVLLSHSTKENLTKYFENDHSLEPDVALAPCYPCHSLHYTKESCPAGEVADMSGRVLGQSPICSLSITPERVLAELDGIYSTWHGTRSAAA